MEHDLVVYTTVMVMVQLPARRDPPAAAIARSRLRGHQIGVFTGWAVEQGYADRSACAAISSRSTASRAQR
jgi:hypothetical protein